MGEAAGDFVERVRVHLLSWNHFGEIRAGQQGAPNSTEALVFPVGIVLVEGTG
jgi:hypothetical protein